MSHHGVIAKALLGSKTLSSIFNKKSPNNTLGDEIPYFVLQHER